MKTPYHRMTQGLLLASGLLLTSIAATILFAPGPFYAGYGIDVSSNVSLANELKAPSLLLLAAGAFMLLGVFRRSFVVPALALGTLIYASYGLSRLASIAIDGVPQTGLIGAAGVELVVGLLCLGALLRERGGRFSWNTVAR
ncbi:MAG: DUF4345 domain-containing protein [Pseudomonadota bacterium]